MSIHWAYRILNISIFGKENVRHGAPLIVCGGHRALVSPPAAPPVAAHPPHHFWIASQKETCSRVESSADMRRKDTASRRLQEGIREPNTSVRGARSERSKK
jgi:hypothetical protein